jgi:ketosteroid isomerase-like protein
VAARSLSGNPPSNPDATDVVAVIERVFAALGEDDRARLSELLCGDFHAFENGVRMSGRDLLAAMARYHSQGRRYRWSVTSPQIEVGGDLAVVVYVNQGSVTDGPGEDAVSMSWLETVVLRRQASQWRLAFVHSTRMPMKPV